jgi:DNA-binding NarL/FixJ family response regulator
MDAGCDENAPHDSRPATPIHVVIASRRQHLLDTLRPRLASEPGIRMLGDPVADPEYLLHRLAERRPELLLLDQLLLDGLAPRKMRMLREHAPDVRVLLWCDAALDGLVDRILRHRFHGFLLTRDSPDTCVKAIRAVCRGELWLPRALLARAVSQRGHAPDPGSATAPIDALPTGALHPLTRREAEVVALLSEGFSNKEIARRLGIMEGTVKKHLQSVFGKLGVHRRSLVMLRQGFGPANFA